MVLLGLRRPRPGGGVGRRRPITVGFVLAGVGLIDVVLLVAHGPFGLAERARALLVSLWLLGLAGVPVPPQPGWPVGPDRPNAPWSPADPRG